MAAPLLAMFPGQGSQFVGMGKDAFGEFPRARLTFEEAEDAIGVKLRALCLEGPADELELTSNQQPAILTLSIALWRILQEEAGLTSQYFAGHSLGEYSALVAAGKLGFADGVRLVRHRGQAMQRAVPRDRGAMAAVLGMDGEKLAALCQQRAKAREFCVEVVNFNSPDQQIISGHREGVDLVCAELGEQGVKTVKLAVSAPFHSSLMAPAREEMQVLLQAQQFNDTASMIIPNLTGELTRTYGADLLIQQIDKPVLWSKSMASAHAAGLETYLEIGPGRVLFGLARKCLPSGMTLLHSHDLKATISKITSLG
jgi:[acyl-carrier-protein] S-malonyltransferase